MFTYHSFIKNYIVKDTNKNFNVINVKQDIILNCSGHTKSLFKKVVANQAKEHFSILSYRFTEYTKQGLYISISVHHYLII